MFEENIARATAKWTEEDRAEVDAAIRRAGGLRRATAGKGLDTEHLRAVGRAATEGPWVNAEQTHDEWFGIQSPYFALGSTVNGADAEFCATARNEWDGLLDEVVRLRGLLRAFAAGEDSMRVDPRCEVRITKPVKVIKSEDNDSLFVTVYRGLADDMSNRKIKVMLIRQGKRVSLRTGGETYYYPPTTPVVYNGKRMTALDLYNSL